MPAHQINDGFGVLVGLDLVWCSGVLAVVGQLVDAAHVDDGVGVDDGSSSSGHHGPDPALLVQDGQLEGRPRLAVQLDDLGFLRSRFPSEGGWVRDITSERRKKDWSQTQLYHGHSFITDSVLYAK